MAWRTDHADGVLSPWKDIAVRQRAVDGNRARQHVGAGAQVVAVEQAGGRRPVALHRDEEVPLRGGDGQARALFTAVGHARATIAMKVGGEHPCDVGTIMQHTQGIVQPFNSRCIGVPRGRKLLHCSTRRQNYSLLRSLAVQP